MNGVNPDVKAAFAEIKGTASIQDVEQDEDTYAVTVKKGGFVYTGEVREDDGIYDQLEQFEGGEQ